MSKKLSIKGGASSHLRPCLLRNSDKHNFREGSHFTNENIVTSLSYLNSYWRDPSVPNLAQFDRLIREDYKATHGRRLAVKGRKRPSPIKESVTVLPNGSPDIDKVHLSLVKRLEKKYGVRCLRWAIHRDEYFDRKGTFNYHAHEVWAFYDLDNHRYITLSRADLCQWQDIVAEETGMPRGRSARETGRKWLSHNEYKISEQEKEMEENQKAIYELEQNIKAMETSLQSLNEKQFTFLAEAYRFTLKVRRMISEIFKEYGIRGYVKGFYEEKKQKGQRFRIIDIGQNENGEKTHFLCALFEDGRMYLSVASDWIRIEPIHELAFIQKMARRVYLQQCAFSPEKDTSERITIKAANMKIQRYRQRNPRPKSKTGLSI